jgi:hypothetical protein
MAHNYKGKWRKVERRIQKTLHDLRVGKIPFNKIHNIGTL